MKRTHVHLLISGSEGGGTIKRGLIPSFFVADIIVIQCPFAKGKKGPFNSTTTRGLGGHMGLPGLVGKCVGNILFFFLHGTTSPEKHPKRNPSRFHTGFLSFFATPKGNQSDFMVYFNDFGGLPVIRN